MSPMSIAQLDEALSKTEAEVQMFPEENKRRFSSFREMQTFFRNEASYWQQANEPLADIGHRFESQVVAALDQAQQSDSPERAHAHIVQALQNAQKTDYTIVYSETPAGGFLAELSKQNGRVAQGAYEFLGDKLSDRLRDIRYLTGVLKGFTFKNPPRSELLAERSAFASLREEIGNTRDDLKAEYRKFAQELTSWKQTTQTEAEQFLSQSKAVFDESHSNWAKTIDQSHRAWQDRIQALETLYRDKLELAGPAEYWSKLVTEYEDKGRKWRRWAVGSAVSLVIFAGAILKWPPAIISNPEVTLSGIRGTVILAVAFSVLVYLIHLFAKLSTSAYHLSRDARERLQLTLVYLGLIQEKAMDPKEREIVLQALFSRADTGLLKSDGGPTMPGPFGSIAELLGRK